MALTESESQGVDAVRQKRVVHVSLRSSALIIDTMDHRRAHLASSLPLPPTLSLPLGHTDAPPCRRMNNVILRPCRSHAKTSVWCTKSPGRRWCSSDVTRLGLSRGGTMHRFFGRKCVTFVVRYHAEKRTGISPLPFLFFYFFTIRRI